MIRFPSSLRSPRMNRRNTPSAAPVASQRRSAVAALETLRRIVRELRLGPQLAEKKLGLSGAQLYVLQQIAARPNASLKDIARATSTDQSSVSVVAGRLVERGLVVRRISPDDGRRAELTVSGAGRRLLARASEDPPQMRLVTALEELPPKELASLGRMLAKVLERVDPDADGLSAPRFDAGPSSADGRAGARRPRR